YGDVMKSGRPLKSMCHTQFDAPGGLRPPLACVLSARALFATEMVVVLSLCAFRAALAAEPQPNPSRDTDKKLLVICAVPDGLPRPGKAEDGSGQGVDIAVARLVAAELQRPLEIHWCASAACSWKCVHEKRCDIVIGQPHGSGPAREVAWSIPYSGSR